MADRPSPAIAALAREAPQKEATADQLGAIQAMVVRVRDIDLELKELGERTAQLAREKNELLHVKLPDAMDAAGIDHIGVPAIGNHPAVDADVRPYYSANIAAGWEEEKRQAGFAYLSSVKASDLIKTEITLAVPREQRAAALKLIRKLNKELKPLGVQPAIKETVHMQTLTAWLKEQVERRGVVPNLDKIGGAVGRVVRLKERTK